MGRTQMLSVPYYLLSEKTMSLPNGSTQGQILIWDGLQWVVGSVCSLFSNNLNNCGSCNNVCPPNPSNATPACVNGTCTIICDAGYYDCDGNILNVCESQLEDLSNCGTCGNICTPKANATVSCDLGVCSFNCNPGFEDCNGIAADGCEVNLNTNTANCSACGTSCPANPPNATYTCVNGTCNFNCSSSNYLDCNGNTADGCEVNIQTDISNCGGCEIICPSVPNSISVCNAGVCSIICNPGFANCNGLVADVCEVNLTTNSNCDSCYYFVNT